MAFISVGLKAGVRALPRLSLSMLRVTSAASREGSTPKCRMIFARSPSVWSSSFMR